MKLLAIDVSTSKLKAGNGWAFWDGTKYTTGCFPFSSYLDFYIEVLELIKKYQPQAMLYAESHGMYNIIRLHARLHGFIDLACEEQEIQSIIISEGHARLIVLGKGRASKEETMSYFQEKSEDIADAKLLIESYIKETN